MCQCKQAFSCEIVTSTYLAGAIRLPSCLHLYSSDMVCFFAA